MADYFGGLEGDPGFLEGGGVDEGRGGGDAFDWVTACCVDRAEDV